MRRGLVGLLLLSALLLAGLALLAERDARRAAVALEAAARTLPTRHGPIPFQEGGAGPALLVIHGAGGGHDQGALLARALASGEVRWIAPARFGYPGAAMPADASVPAQAEALADLLDALGLERVAVMGMSGGVPVALHLAQAFPERVRALVLLSSAPFAPLGIEDQETPVPIWVYDALFATELPYWLVLRLAPGRVDALFDADARSGGELSEDEGNFVRDMREGFVPVRARRKGLANEGAAIDPRHPVDLARISAPALIVHAADDRIAPVATARHLAAGLARAELVLFETGGHLLLGHHRETAARVEAFLRRASGP